MAGLSASRYTRVRSRTHVCNVDGVLPSSSRAPWGTLRSRRNRLASISSRRLSITAASAGVCAGSAAARNVAADSTNVRS